MYTHNGRTIQVNRTWTSDDGYQHPKNWAIVWKEQDLERWSVVYSADPVKLTWDNRFYLGYLDDNETLNPRALTDTLWVDIEGNAVNDPETGEQGVTPGLKTTWIANKKKEANNLLHSTDWYVVRKQEKGTAIPSAITTERDAIRSAMAALETKITNASDLDAFIALFATSKDGDGNTVKSDMDCF